MSITLDCYNTAQLRVWLESDLKHKDHTIEKITDVIRSTLLNMNQAWSFNRCRTPLVVPNAMVSHEYSERDVWKFTTSEHTLRPETTAGSYAVARHILQTTRAKPPICVWQEGPSFRRETSDGANAAKLRYFQFDQLEYQCIYSVDTKADYRAAILPALAKTLSWLTRCEARICESDRLPSYSESTMDIEVLKPHDTSTRWTEVASISIRNDFDPKFRVLEIAIGLDRVVDIFNLAN